MTVTTNTTKVLINRSTRYDTANNIAVKASSLGSDFQYTLNASNISKSGLLLNWPSSHHVPFIENAIIEMIIDPDKQWVDNPTKLLGKVVRKSVSPSLDNQQFGIRIIERDVTDEQAWLKYFEKLSKNTNEFEIFKD